MSFEPIQNFFEGTISGFGMRKTIGAAQVVHKFNTQVLEKLFTAVEAGSNIRAKSFVNKTLKIEVSSSLWAQEVFMRKQQIIREMNAEFGEETINKIKTELTQLKNE